MEGTEMAMTPEEKRAKKAEASRQYRARNAAKVKAYNTQYRLEHKELCKQLKKASRKRNPATWRESLRRRAAVYKAKYPDKVRAQKKRTRSRATTELRDSYVACLVVAQDRLPVAAIPRELIELKREQLLVARAFRELKQTTKELYEQK
jgi:hypothetical protein